MSTMDARDERDVEDGDELENRMEEPPWLRPE
jgi:hypothetical protein